MANEVTVYESFDGVLASVIFTGGKCSTVISNSNAERVRKLVVSSYESAIEFYGEFSKDNAMDFSEYMNRLIDSQIKKWYNSQAVTLKAVEVKETKSGFSFKAGF